MQRRAKRISDTNDEDLILLVMVALNTVNFVEALKSEPCESETIKI